MLTETCLPLSPAQGALQRGDWSEVVRLCAAQPDAGRSAPERARIVAPALAALARYDDAEFILSEALAVEPDDELLQLQASIASARGDWPMARDRWQACLARHPLNEEAAAGLATAFCHLSHFDEADRVLEIVRAGRPGLLLLDSTWAWTGQARAYATGTWAEAASRWRSFLAAHVAPTDESVNIGFAYEQSGALDEAQDIYRRAIAQYPDDPRFPCLSAALAERLGNRLAALAQWRAAALRFPGHLPVHAGEACALAAAGMIDEAQLIVDRALTTWPGPSELLAVQAMLASLRGQWFEATAAWQLAIAELGERTDLCAGLAHALEQASPRSLTPAELGMSYNDLMLAFESLGDNCELGMVQRGYGAEPVGLVRFANIQPEHIIPALVSRFAGVGSAEQTILEVVKDEYVTHDSRFNMWSHTHLKADTARYDEILRKMCKRLAFLRKNLIYDLAQANKIFVYKSSYSNLDEGFIKALFAAINSYQVNSLLVVRTETLTRPSGSVEEVAPGLMLGYIDKLSPPDNAVQVSMDAWLTVCQRAHALWTRRQAWRAAATCTSGA